MPLNQNQGEPTPEYLSQMFETEWEDNILYYNWTR
jgi:hypothetical protein